MKCEWLFVYRLLFLTGSTLKRLCLGKERGHSTYNYVSVQMNEFKIMVIYSSINMVSRYVCASSQGLEPGQGLSINHSSHLLVQHLPLISQWWALPKHRPITATTRQAHTLAHPWVPMKTTCLRTCSGWWMTGRRRFLSSPTGRALTPWASAGSSSGIRLCLEHTDHWLVLQMWVSYSFNRFVFIEQRGHKNCCLCSHKHSLWRLQQIHSCSNTDTHRRSTAAAD